MKEEYDYHLKNKNKRSLLFLILISISILVIVTFTCILLIKLLSYHGLRQCKPGEFIPYHSNYTTIKSGHQAKASILFNPQTSRKYFFKSHRKSNVFRHERNILASLQGSTAVGAVVCYMLRPERGIVMELAEGGDLLSDTWYRRDNPFRFEFYDQLIHATAHFISSLASLHSQGYLHNDLRPNNVIFSHPHRLQVIDFGLSRKIGKKGHHSRCVHNSPPETAGLSDPKARYQRINSTASDWYTFGVLTHFFMAKGLFCIQQPEDEACEPGQQELFWPYKPLSIDPVTKRATYDWNPEPPVPFPAPLKHFLSLFIVIDPLKRDFRGKKLQNEVLQHPLFASTNWTEINKNLLSAINNRKK